MRVAREGFLDLVLSGVLSCDAVDVVLVEEVLEMVEGLRLVVLGWEETML